MSSVIPSTAGAIRPAYDGDMPSFAWLVIRNTLLTMITVGIYRFWAKTRIRQYLWSRISLLDDRFEYTGRGRELFFGFLIVLFVFVLGGLDP